jgi:hypothetical protein
VVPIPKEIQLEGSRFKILRKRYLAWFRRTGTAGGACPVEESRFKFKVQGSSKIRKRVVFKLPMST